VTLDWERAADREWGFFRPTSWSKVDMPQSALAHLSMRSETPLSIASLQFEFRTFAAAAPEQLKPPLGAADTRHRQRSGWQRAYTSTRR
jgi:hypothetical protein